MDRKKKNGMWIRQEQNRTDAGKTWVISMLTALFACEMLVLSLFELTGFTGIYAPWMMALAAGGTAVFYGILLKFNKQKWFYPTVLATLLLLVTVRGKRIRDGGCTFWNMAGDSWTAVSGKVTPELEASADPLNLAVFSIFLGIVMALLCCALTSLDRGIMAVLLPVLLFLAMILFQSDSVFQYLVPCLVMAICLLVCGSREEKMPVGVAARWALVVLCSIVMIMAAAAMDLEQWGDEISANVRGSLHALLYETEYTTLPEGDFSAYKEKDGKGQVALTVTMEQPEEMYLRGFTGVTFSQDVWRGLDTAALGENEDFLYWMNLNGWNPQIQFANASLLTGASAEEDLRKVTVDNLNACSEYLYVPYSLFSEENLSVQDICTHGVMAEGNRGYTYTVLSGGTDKIGKVLKELEAADDVNVMEYRKAENAYRWFVYSYYLEVPKETEEQLSPYWETVLPAEGKQEKITAAKSQGYVRAFLKECFPEDGEKSEIPLPLESAKGSSYQYATVAVLTLRHFGIPARYAEGYVVTRDMAESMEKKNSVEVDSSCATAWAEVYQDGIGWIPMDMTAGIEQQKSGSDKDKEGDEPEEILPKGEKQKESEDMSQEPEAGGGYVVSIQKALSLTFLLILFLVIFLLAALMLRRRAVLKRRKNRWEDKNINNAAAWIFADTERLLSRLGFHRGGGSMTELLLPVEERLGTAFAAAFKEMIEINFRAIFSSCPLDEEHRQRAKAFYADTLEYLKTDAKWYQRWWMQWGLCLY